MDTLPLHDVTPVILHQRLSHQQNRQIYLKMECDQQAASFKIRGIGLLCQHEAAKGIKHFVCPSGGNAGYAAALAGQKLNIQTTIVVPVTTSKMACDRIIELGATLRIQGEAWDDANRLALELAQAEGTAYIPAFDHPLLWQGHASLIDELKQQIEKPDAIVLAVGGGGLMCGVIEGLHRNGWQDVAIVACETEGADSFRAAVEAKKLVSLPSIASIATSLGAKKVAQRALDWVQQHDIRVATLTDKQAVSAILNFADDLRALVEPACGAALVPVYEQLPVLKEFKNIVVIVCGGIGVSLAQLAKWQQAFCL